MPNNCDAVLAPNEETIKDDYSSAQAYVYVNAEKDWDEMRRGTAGGTSVSGMYKLLSLDYGQSNSASEFQLKVRESLSKMGYNASEASAKATNRKYTTEQQVNAWSTCMGGDSVILTIQTMNFKRATLKAWMRLTGVERGLLDVTVAGGTIDEKTAWETPVTGYCSTTFIVDCDQGESFVTVTAKVAGRDDEIELDFGALRQQGGMIGMKLSVSRRVDTVDTPYTVWIPHTIRVSPLSVPYTWVAAGEPHLNVAATKYNISFDILHPSRYRDPGAPFDGFVIGGFTKDVMSVILLNNSTCTITPTISDTRREIVLDVRQFSEAGRSFALALTFDEGQAAQAPAV